MSASNYSIAPYLLRPATGKPGATERPPWIQGGLFRDLSQVFARRWRIIAATLVVVVGAAALYSTLAEPRYRARATVLIEARAPQVLHAKRFGEAEEPFGSAKYDYYQTQFHLLRSPDVAERVVAHLKLAEHPEFASDTAEATAPADDMQMQPIVRRYLRNLSIQPVRGTRLVGVEFESASAELAAEVANAHAKLFVDGALERLYESKERIRTFLYSKLTELQGEMQVAETKLLEFQSANRMLPVALTTDVASERLMDLSRRLTDAQAARILLEAEYNLVESGDYENLPALQTDANIQQLRADFNRLQLEYALLAAKWRPNYPALRQLSSQLDQARALLTQEVASIADAVKAKYIAARATAEELKKEMEEQRDALLNRKDEESQLLTLSRASETTRALYDNLLAHVKELDVAGSSNVSNISVAEAALTPHRPSFPRTRFNIVLSLVTGLLLGTGLAFLRDAADRTIRDAEDVHRATGLATLAVIPKFADEIMERQSRALLPFRGNGRGVDGPRNGRGELASPRLLMGNGFVPPSAEGYRTLRTSLLLNRAPTPPRVIVMTSAVGTEGKTTTAVNTAASLASCGATVLLVDADLRLPRCHEALGAPLEPGLSSYLAGQVMTQPIQNTRIKNLSFVAAGRPAENPAELLTSWRIWQLLKNARDHFDFVVIDSPPLLAVSDGLLLANVADGVLLVVESERSREEQIHAAMLRLHETGAVVLGAVLNRGEIAEDYYSYVSPAGAARKSADTVEEPAAEQG